ncbi:low choriolytic enzyme-like [Sphaeramia orbicularis]|uniref:low choriolytic enzyme-like n=1 Tax=Sphaeramia orbicularis TaxID=375764 RepID=UPI00117ED384|nr:low choriolytic enzyme-like [Sphaeramia orbicularis]
MDLMGLLSVVLLVPLGYCNAYSPVEDYDGDADISALTSENSTITTTILRMNEGSFTLLEGDVEFPKNRNAMKCWQNSQCSWPKSDDGKVRIPFMLSDKYDSEDKRTILYAMEEFHNKTCIRFIPRQGQTAYIYIEPRFGCSSMLGYLGDKVTVSLQRYGCIENGIIQHELLHALGFHHEHTRSDRDKYVKINWENIHDYYAYNFKKKDTNNLDTPYDYNSIMHYDRNAFGNYRSETITPIPDPSVSIGQKGVLSTIDILRINRLYRC